MITWIDDAKASAARRGREPRNGMTVGAMPEYSDYYLMNCDKNIDQYNAQKYSDYCNIDQDKYRPIGSGGNVFHMKNSSLPWWVLLQIRWTNGYQWSVVRSFICWLSAITFVGPVFCDRSLKPQKCNRQWTADKRIKIRFILIIIIIIGKIIILIWIIVPMIVSGVRYLLDCIFAFKKKSNVSSFCD